MVVLAYWPLLAFETWEMDSIVNWSISRCVTINSNPDTNLSLTPTLSPYFHHFAHAMSRSQTEMYHTSNGASCLRISVVFTARCYASAVLAMALCPSVCLSVCLSVCPSQAGVLLKWQNVESHKHHHTIPQGVWFSDAKDLHKIRPGSPLRGRQMQVEWVKIGDFRQISGYISKTVKDRHIVSIKVE